MARPLLRLSQAAAVALVVGLFALLVWKTIFADSATLTNAIRAGERPAAPAFDLPVIWNENQTWPRQLRTRSDDGRVALAELRGYPVVLNFWASWCRPCRAEAPILAAAAKAERGRVVFLGVDVKDFTTDAKRFAKDNGFNYVSVRDTESVYDDYGLTGLPETFFVDARGRVVSHFIGEIDTEELAQGIRAARAATNE